MQKMVFVERDINTRRVTADDMQIVLENHENFPMENNQEHLLCILFVALLYSSYQSSIVHRVTFNWYSTVPCQGLHLHVHKFTPRLALTYCVRVQHLTRYVHLIQCHVLSSTKEHLEDKRVG